MGLALFQNMFHNLLIYTNNFCFWYITVSYFFETFPGVWLAGGGWLVGNSDFNENPVVSLDLEMDLGLRLRVCQNTKIRNLRLFYNYFVNLKPKVAIQIIDQVLEMGEVNIS